MLEIVTLKNKALIFLSLTTLTIFEGIKIVPAATCQVTIMAWNSSDVDFQKPVTFRMKVGTIYSGSTKLERNDTWTHVIDFNCPPSGASLRAIGSAITLYTNEPLECNPVQLRVIPTKPVTIEYEATVFKPSSVGNPRWFENSCAITPQEP